MQCWIKYLNHFCAPADPMCNLAFPLLFEYDEYLWSHAAKDHLTTASDIKKYEKAFASYLECPISTTNAFTVVSRNKLRKFNRIVCCGHGQCCRHQTNCPSRTNSPQSLVGRAPDFLCSPKEAARRKIRMCNENIWSLCNGSNVRNGRTASL